MARRRTSGDAVPAVELSASMVVWSARSACASPSLPSASSTACSARRRAPRRQHLAAAARPRAALPTRPAWRPPRSRPSSSAPISARRSASISSGRQRRRRRPCRPPPRSCRRVLRACSAARRGRGAGAARATSADQRDANRRHRFNASGNAPRALSGHAVRASLGARLRVGELDLAAVVGALAEQPEAGRRDDAARATRSSSCSACARRTPAWPAGCWSRRCASRARACTADRRPRTSCRRGDVVELHLDLAVVERLREERQVLEVPGPLVGALLFGRPDLVDLVLLQRADEARPATRSASAAGSW